MTRTMLQLRLEGFLGLGRPQAAFLGLRIFLLKASNYRFFGVYLEVQFYLEVQIPPPPRIALVKTVDLDFAGTEAGPVIFKCICVYMHVCVFSPSNLGEIKLQARTYTGESAQAQHIFCKVFDSLELMAFELLCLNYYYYSALMTPLGT